MMVRMTPDTHFPVVQAERNLDDAPAERRCQVEPALVEVADLVEREPTGHGRRVEDGEAGDVHRRAQRLHREEAGIETGEALHRDSFAPRVCCS